MTNTKWVLVAGGFENLSSEHERAATALGRMLAQSGYGLIIGRWTGVDYFVTRGFRDGAGPTFARRLMQVDTTGGPETEPKPGRIGFRILDPRDADGSHTYSHEAVSLADAGVVVPGCRYSKPAMDALIRQDKPVLPVASLGEDAFDVFIDMLKDWDNLSIRGALTRRQFLELAMPSNDISVVRRLLFAALQSQPVLFVSYRHADVPDAAARIAELLVHRYGSSSVFLDVEGLIPGRNFDVELERAIASSRALIPIVGPRWEGDQNPMGGHRIADPDDWVARELLLARSSGCSVLPVLVQRTALKPAALPASLQWLEPIQHTQATYADLESDLRRLFQALDSLILSAEHPAPVAPVPGAA